MKNAVLKFTLFLVFSIAEAFAVSAPAEDPFVDVLNSLQGSIARRGLSLEQMHASSSSGDAVAAFLAEPIHKDLEFDKKALGVIDLLRVLRNTSIPSDELFHASSSQMPALPISLADLLLHYNDDEIPYCQLTSITEDDFDLLNLNLAVLQDRVQSIGQDLEGRLGRNLSQLQQDSLEFFTDFEKRLEKVNAEHTAYSCQLMTLYRQDPKPADYEPRSTVLLECAKAAREDKELFEKLGNLCGACVKSAIHCKGYDDLEDSDSEGSGSGFSGEEEDDDENEDTAL